MNNQNHMIKITEILLFCIAVFLIFRSNTERSVSDRIICCRDSVNIKIDVRFINNGTFTLNTLEKHRAANIFISPRKKNDIPVSKNAMYSKPTVFESYRLVKESTLIKRFICFDKDLLSFDFSPDKTDYTGNPKNDILNLLIKHDNDLGLYAENDYGSYFSEMESEHKDRMDLLKNYKQLFSNEELIVLKNYLLSYFYSRIFYIDYSKVNISLLGSTLDGYQEKLLKDYRNITSVNSLTDKRIMYGLLKYSGAKKKLFPKNDLELLPYLDPSLYKTESLDGFILDYLDTSDQISEKRIAMEKAKPYMLHPEFFSKMFKKTDPKIEASVFFRSDLKKINFKDLIRTDKDLVVIDVWASWCVPCIEEFPALVKMKEKYGQKVEFVSVSIDKDKEKWKKAAEKYNLDTKHSAVIDNFETSAFISGFKIGGIPRFILLNNKNEILSEYFNRPSDEYFEKFLNENLK